MKNGIIFLALTISTCFTALYAQISIRENDVVERPVFKPKEFDSLTNIALQKHPTDYKKFIGYKLYYLPKSKNFKSKYPSDNEERIINFLFSKDSVQITKSGKIPFEQTNRAKIFGSPSNLSGAALNQYNEKKSNYENIDKEKTNIYLPLFYHEKTDIFDGKIIGKIGTNPDSIYGKYFTILNIEGKEPYGSKDFKKLEDVEIEESRNWQLALRITLRNEHNKDTIYWIIDQARFLDSSPFFLVPYFEKQRNFYLDQNIVLKSSDRTNTNLQNLVDVNTGEMVNIKYGEVWKCSDVSFIDSKDAYYLKCFFFLKNGDKEIKISLESGLLRSYFILESEFIQIENEKKKKEEERQREQEERKKQEQIDKAKYKSDCIAKWGAKTGGYIADGKVVLGMNKEMCLASWGNPININRTVIRGLTSEQWVFGWGTYLYFENGVLTAIQN